MQISYLWYGAIQFLNCSLGFVTLVESDKSDALRKTCKCKTVRAVSQKVRATVKIARERELKSVENNWLKTHKSQ
jgi:hypothetical protein